MQVRNPPDVTRGLLAGLPAGLFPSQHQISACRRSSLGLFHLQLDILLCTVCMGVAASFCAAQSSSAPAATRVEEIEQAREKKQAVTTMAAAHVLERVGYGIEMSPAYCDVVLRRIAHLTGEEPMLATTRQPLPEVATGRRAHRHSHGAVLGET